MWPLRSNRQQFPPTSMRIGDASPPAFTREFENDGRTIPNLQRDRMREVEAKVDVSMPPNAVHSFLYCVLCEENSK